MSKTVQQEYGRLLSRLMPANNGVLKGIVSQETMLGTGVVLHHALVWIVHVFKNPDAEVSGFVEVKLVYTDANLNKHSDISADEWNKLKPQPFRCSLCYPAKAACSLDPLCHCSLCIHIAQAHMPMYVIAEHAE